MYESLVWSLVIVVDTEPVKGALLLASVGLRRDGGLGLEGTVEALEAAILLRMAWLGTLGYDAQLDPPDGDRAQPAQANASEGSPVVGAYGLGQAVLPKDALKAAPDARGMWTGKPLAGQEVARVAVHHGQGIYGQSIGSPELALEIGAPNHIGPVHRSEGIVVGRSPSDPAPGLG